MKEKINNEAYYKVLNRYMNRLLKIDPRSRSLKLTRLTQRGAFDLKSIEKYYKTHSKTQEILSSMKNIMVGRNVPKIEILPDPYKFEKSEQENILLLSKSLKSLLTNINNIFKETGKYELNVGYPFIEGRFKDGTLFKAPILLFRAGIEMTYDKWFLELYSEPPVLNSVFINAYIYYNEIKTEINLDLSFENFEDIIDYLCDIRIISARNKKLTGEIIQFYPPSSDISYNPSIVEHLILGHFPLASSIYYDYKVIIEKPVQKNVMNLILNEDNDNYSFNNTPSQNNIDLKEKELIYISDLDYTQLIALKLSQNLDNLVIYGPPGTGKSQTIANMIANFLYHGKKVLVVSEKRVALDVVVNRLHKIKERLVLIHDPEKEKKEFYCQITELLNEIEKRYLFYYLISTNSNPYLITSKQVSTEIENLISNIEEIHKVFTSKMKIGLSFSEACSILSRFKKDLYSYDNDYENYKKIFLMNITYFKDLHKHKFNEILEICKKMLNLEDIVFNYLELSLKEESLNKINYNADPNKIELAIMILNTIIEKASQNIKFEHYDILKNSPTFLYFKDKYEDISEDHIRKITKELIDHERKRDIIKLKIYKRIFEGLFGKIFKSLLKRTKIYSKYIKLSSDIEILETNLIIYVKESIDQFKNFLESLKQISNIIDIDYYLRLIYSWSSGKDIRLELENLIEDLKLFKVYRKILSEIKNLSLFEESIINIFKKKILERKDYKKFLSLLPYIILEKEVREYENANLDILGRYKDYEAIIEEINKKIKEKMSLIIYEINEKIDNNFVKKAKENIKFYKEMKRQSQKQKRLMSIRNFFEKFSDLLIELYPCWLLTPEVVSQVLPLKEGLFDIVIFDEASQIFIERAIPSIYRSKKVIIAGDDKQLRPTSEFLIRINDDVSEMEDYEYEIETAASFEEESLLDLAKINYPSTHLLYHYRSYFEELIAFSNNAFYGSKLIFCPPSHLPLNEKPIERILVDGKWENRVNFKEAETVVNLVLKLLNTRKEKESIGIITFNINQRDLIEEMLEDLQLKNPIMGNLVWEEMNRFENGEDKSLFVKNIENVQGDERDIIIFSIGYAPDNTGRIYQYFGSLNKVGGENRLNVAITRAKKKIYVVTSIEPELLDVENTKNKGPKLLKEYLKYAREVSNRNIEAYSNILKGLCLVEKESLSFDSFFEQEVFEELQNMLYKYNLKVKTQIGVSKFRIDLAIYDPRSGSYLLGIECDGATYHSLRSARERDITRQKFLESKGWKILRIWSYDWWNDKRKVLKDIEEIIISKI